MSRLAGLNVRAVCDLDEPRCQQVAAELEAVAVPHYTALLESDVDAVILANAFDEHAPLAIAALEAGKHVLSETSACNSPAEAVALLDAVERSGRVYLLAENYVHKPHVRTIGGLLGKGTLGEVEYVECEYLHAMSPSDRDGFRGDPDAWRRRITPTAYCTHTIAPIMQITGARPTAVSAFLVPASGDAGTTAALLMVRMDDGSITKALHGFLQGEPRSGWSRLRVHGSRGLAENACGGDDWAVRLLQEAWTSPDKVRSETMVPPDRTGIPDGVPIADEDDYLVCAELLRSIRGEAPPFFGAEDAVTASLVGMYAAVSVEAGSVPIDVPDIRDRAVRADLVGRDVPSLTVPVPA